MEGYQGEARESSHSLAGEKSTAVEDQQHSELTKDGIAQTNTKRSPKTTQTKPGNKRPSLHRCEACKARNSLGSCLRGMCSCCCPNQPTGPCKAHRESYLKTQARNRKKGIFKSNSGNMTLRMANSQTASSAVSLKGLETGDIASQAQNNLTKGNDTEVAVDISSAMVETVSTPSGSLSPSVAADEAGNKSEKRREASNRKKGQLDGQEARRKTKEKRRAMQQAHDRIAEDALTGEDAVVTANTYATKIHEGEGVGETENGSKRDQQFVTGKRKFMSRESKTKRHKFAALERDEPMSYQDKRRLCRDVTQLSLEHLQQIMKIISNQMPDHFGEAQMAAETLDVDMSLLSDATLQLVEQYVYAVTPKHKRTVGTHKIIYKRSTATPPKNATKTSKTQKAKKSSMRKSLGRGYKSSAFEFNSDSEMEANRKIAEEKRQLSSSASKSRKNSGNNLVLPPRMPEQQSPASRPRRTRKKRLFHRHEPDSFSSRDDDTSILDELLQECLELLKRLMAHQYGYIFNQPVDPVRLEIPDYFDIIKNPMDLGTVLQQLKSGHYETPSEFAADVRLVWSNAMLYNPPGGGGIHEIAQELSELFEQEYKPIAKRETKRKQRLREREIQEREAAEQRLKEAEEKQRRKAAAGHDNDKEAEAQPMNHEEQEDSLLQQEESMALEAPTKLREERH